MLSRTLALVIACCSSASADVLIVDGTGATPESFMTIQSAIDSAQSGDTVLVTGSGTVVFDEELVLTAKGITLIADNDVAVHAKSLELASIPITERTVLRGIDFGLPGATPNNVALNVFNAFGSIRIENCDFYGRDGAAGLLNGTTPIEFGYSGYAAAEILGCNDLVFHQCNFFGGQADPLDAGQYYSCNGGDGLEISFATVSMSGCTVIAAHGAHINVDIFQDGGDGGHGLIIRDSVISLAGTVIESGDGGDGACDLPACDVGGPGGDAIRLLDSAGVLRLRDVTTLAGVGGLDGDGGGFAGDGVELRNPMGSLVLSYPSLFRDFTTASSPLRAGDDLTLTLAGLAGDTIFVWGALDTQSTFVPKFHGPYLLAGATLGPTAFALGTLPADGALELDIAIPPLPGLDALELSLQMFTQRPGGGVFFGPGSTIVLLGG